MPITLEKDWGNYPAGSVFAVLGEEPDGSRRAWVDQQRAAQLLKDKFAIEGDHGAAAKPAAATKKKASVKRG